MSKHIVLAITGASGVIYGIRTLEILKKIPNYCTHLIFSKSAIKNISIENASYSLSRLFEMISKSKKIKLYENSYMEADLSSGSFLTDGMIIAPCTIKTLSSIVNSYADNLITRAADVTLKEKRKLVLVVRETPLHLGHLRLLTAAAEMGAHILPPMPAFYHFPKTIDDIINQTVGKILDYFGIQHTLFKRWS